jgi:hypothetical protein
MQHCLINNYLTVAAEHKDVRTTHHNYQNARREKAESSYITVQFRIGKRIWHHRRLAAGEPPARVAKDYRL